MGHLEGRTAVVVGGHSGFGEAISRRFSAEGAHVIVAGRRRELVESAAAEVGGTAVVCDVTDDGQIQGLVAEALDVSGRIDVAVNCAGFEQATPLSDLTVERLRAMHAVQLDGALMCMRHLGNAMVAGGGGSFVTLSSLTARNPAAGLTAYASAKAGVEYATRIAAVEYGPAGVRFNCVAASLIETPMTARMFAIPPVVQAMVEVTPLGRMGTVDDVAAAVLYLVGDDGAFVTGQTLCVDGGASLLMLPSPQMFADAARRHAEAQAAAQQ